QVAMAADDATGLRAIVAIHSTVLGPGLGGTRFYPFASERDALVDVLRLAKGMAYKHAACGNDLGGAKAVILGDPGTVRTDTLADVRTDLVTALAGELGATIADPARIHEVECDVVSPCALGATLNERTIPELRCAAVCGCANNQLATDEDGDRLAAGGVLYAP